MPGGREECLSEHARNEGHASASRGVRGCDEQLAVLSRRVRQLRNSTFTFSRIPRVKGRDAQRRLSCVETGDEVSEALNSNNT